MPRRKAFALATTLIVATFLLLLGLSIMVFTERDYRFAANQDDNARAFFLARAGLRFGAVTPPAVGQTVIRSLPDGDGQHRFAVTLAASGDLESVGLVLSPDGEVRAQRKLVTPKGQPGRVVDASQ